MKIGIGEIIILVLVALILYFAFVPKPILPPTTVIGHSEQVPNSRILKAPMPDPMHRHMLEHSEGRGVPGVVINYNCNDFECEEGLVEKLESIAMGHNHVYVAPYPKMSAKIALTKRGSILTLDEFDEEKIMNFINS